MANYKVRMQFSPHTIHSIGIGGIETIYIHISGRAIPKNATILEYRDAERVVILNLAYKSRAEE